MVNTKSPVLLTMYEFEPPWYKLRSWPAPSVSLPAALLPDALSESASASTRNNPDVPISEEPTLICPNPDVILPLLRAPTLVSDVASVMLFCDAVEIVPCIVPPPVTVILPVVLSVLALESQAINLPEVSP